MNVLTDAMRLITQPPGDLVYFLVTLFALQQALFPALMARRDMPKNAQAKRWVVTVAVLLLGRATLIVIGLLGSAGLLSPSVILPPLERWVELVAVILVVWAAIWSSQSKRWLTYVYLGVLGLSLVFYVYTAASWSQLEPNGYAFNGLFLEGVWELVTLSIIILHLVLIIVMRPVEWEWGMGMLVFWALGHIAQLLWPNSQIHFSGWQRLSALVAFPLLSVLVHRQTQPSVAVSETSSGFLLPDGHGLQDVLHNVESARQLEPSLIVASSKLAELAGAEMCAVALSVDGEPPKLRVVAVHPPTGLLEAPELELPAYSTLSEVYTEQQARVVQAPFKPTWLPALYNRIGMNGEGPLLVLPMSYKENRLGLLLFGNPTSERPWASESLGGYRLIASLLATSITRAQNQNKEPLSLGRVRSQNAEGEGSVSLDSERKRLEMDLGSAQREIETLKKRLMVLAKEVRARDKDLARLNKELEAKSEKPDEAELSFWQKEVQELAQDREVFQQQVQDLERDRQVLMQERTRLTEKLSQTRSDLSAAEEKIERYQKQQSTEAGQQQDATTEGIASCTYGIVLVDQDGQISLADALARRLLHLPEGDVTGMPIDGAYPDPDWAQLVSELLSDEPNARRQAHITLSEEDDLEVEMVTLVGRDGKTDGLAIALQTPEGAVERQEAVVSLANEFRTPMTAITGYTDLLLGEQAGILTEMQRQFLERVKANVEQLGHHLNDLILTASPDSRPVEITPQPIDLIEIIEEAIMGLAARFRERKLAVRLDLPPELGRVQADRDSLYQIMLRLLSNAVLCSQQGTEVVISAQEEIDKQTGAAFVRIAVVDTGGGIATEDFGRVFRRFYRANQPLVQGMGETGIGMAVAKTLVEANGGEISVKSTPGVGSTFSFALPINAVGANSRTDASA